MAGRRYAPIRDYAVIGDGRTVALVARDGRIDWLCLPNLDSPSVFAALLDADRGGYFELCPDVPFEVQRRYVPGTNAMTLPGVGLSPVRELARRIEGLAGRVPLRWRVEPRFGYASAATRFVSRGAWAVAVNGGDALAVCAWDAGRPTSEEGAIAAAATTSLPEGIGGERNWDYRYCWIRDSSFSMEALLQLGCPAEATSFFWWFMHATRLTLPRLQVFYRLDGGAYAPERTLPLEGYRGSRPVRIGNGAAGQLQLDTYGELLDAAFVYADKGYSLDASTGRDLARVADFVCEHWRDPDAGIWEVRAAPRHHTQSKAMCWVALDRAVRLADAGHLPRARAPRWRAEAAAIRRFVDTQCWSTAKDS